MQDDPFFGYLVKKASIRRFYDVMISHYLTPTNFVTEGCKAALVARIYPDEQVMVNESFKLA